MTKPELKITANVTPNPETLKFLLDQQVIESGIYNFTNAQDAKGSYMPEKLFEIEGVEGVMIGTNFVSVTKSNAVDWTTLVEPVIDTIKLAYQSDENLIDEAYATQHGKSDDTEDIQKIKHILDTEIRPAVAMDGGDITFHSYEEGILTLQLQGACSGCPSSTMTLKMGIENRLKEEIPTLIEVVQV